MHPNNFNRSQCFRVTVEWAVVALLIVTGIGTSVADENHYNNIIVGNRAAGMGGAYTAISDDATGLYYNPAGIVYTSGSNVSGSMNALNMTNTEYKNVLGGVYHWKRKSTVLFPNYFGIFQPLGKGKIGFLYAVPDSIEEDQDQTFYNIPNTNPQVDSFTINFNNKDTTYNFGPSYAYKLSENLSIGITLNLYIRTQKRINNQLSHLSNNSDNEWVNYYYTSEESGIRPLFGIMWSPQEKYSFGITMSDTLILDSTTKLQFTCKGAATITYSSNSNCQNNVITSSVIESTDKRDLPFTVSVGGAYFHSSELLISADLNYFASTEDTYVSGRESVLNFAFGSEYYLNNQWALRGGIYSNFANTPALSSQSTGSIQLEHIDLWGLSTSISHFAQNSVLTGGINYSWGTGKAQLIGEDQNGKIQLQNVNQSSLTIFMSASYEY